MRLIFNCYLFLFLFLVFVILRLPFFFFIEQQSVACHMNAAESLMLAKPEESTFFIFFLPLLLLPRVACNLIPASVSHNYHINEKVAAERRSETTTTTTSTRAAATAIKTQRAKGAKGAQALQFVHKCIKRAGSDASLRPQPLAATRCSLLERVPQCTE